ncbi:AI-2E family transporter [Sporohalobacter salinus]|uniref:AI-2E family transporter n=1 Tax=Sporohalobacter salinus TaxID=1494606 RepID=UPI001960EC46|nr:AI-2E family transporter [Sporohalobacter salinus]MBM7623338.1 putative PurR-regulated permease PerM [Sporohalobacter salinus]
MFTGRFFKVLYGLILILLSLFLAGQIPYVMDPLSTVLSIILLPILLGGFFYYLLRPIVCFFTDRVGNKNFAVLITFLLIIIFVVSVIYFGGSIIYIEIEKLIKYFSLNYETIRESINQIIKLGDGHLNFLSDFNIQKRLFAFVQGILERFSNYNFMGAFSSLTNLGTIIVLIPFVVFYFLKDDNKIYQLILSCFAEENKEPAKRMLSEIDKALSTYIGTQLIVAFILGIFMFIGYMVIGLPNSLALALIIAVTSLIPILGPALGILPALFVAITTNFLMVVKLFVVLAIAQNLEGNLVRPLVQGGSLNIHPLVVLFLIVISILLFGILGALFVVPIYVVARIVIKRRKEFNNKS